MKVIKFRGRDYWTGKWHFGFYAEDEDGANIIEGHKWYLVKPDSVAQMVGVDIDGNEVYEGDILENRYGDTFKVSVHCFPSSAKNLKVKARKMI